MRKLASIQVIKEINSIPDADQIEVCSILGWKVVSRKGEFKVGDLVIYLEIDSLLPVSPWSDFLKSKNHPDKPIRLRSVKLRGQVSQGLLLPLSILPETIHEWKEGDDVSSQLNILKYEPSISADLAGKVRGIFPGLFRKTDEPRIQGEPNLIEEFQNEHVVFTIKMDGTSGTFGNIEGDHHVCSRNLSLLDDEVNTYWKMYHKYNLKKVLDDVGEFAIQGEVCGEGIQKNRMGIKGHDLYVFNVYNIRANRFLDFHEFLDFCSQYGLQSVPVEKTCIFDYPSIDVLVEDVQNCIYPTNGGLGEGWVIRPVIERYSETLCGRASFKVINNKYLLKHGE